MKKNIKLILGFIMAMQSIVVFADINVLEYECSLDNKQIGSIEMGLRSFSKWDKMDYRPVDMDLSLWGTKYQESNIKLFYIKSKRFIKLRY